MFIAREPHRAQDQHHVLEDEEDEGDQGRRCALGGGRARTGCSRNRSTGPRIPLDVHAALGTWRRRAGRPGRSRSRRDASSAGTVRGSCVGMPRPCAYGIAGARTAPRGWGRVRDGDRGWTSAAAACDLKTESIPPWIMKSMSLSILARTRLMMMMEMKLVTKESAAALPMPSARACR